MDVCASSDAEGLLTALGHNRDSIRVSTEAEGEGVGGVTSLRRSVSDKVGGTGNGVKTPRRSSSDGSDRDRQNVLEFKGSSGPSLQRRLGFRVRVEGEGAG